MPSSNAYQTVVAQQVRETEAIAFFKDNKIATPARVTAITTIGATAQPAIKTDALADPQIGKNTGRDGVESAYNADGVNVS